MRVLIIGGTRYFGKLVVQKFLARGDEVSVLSRGNSRPIFLNDVTHIQVDRSDSQAMCAALAHRDFDLVIDNIAFERKDVELSVALFRGRVGKYVLTSTVSVYGGIGHSLKPWQKITPANYQEHYFTEPGTPHPFTEDSIDISNVGWGLRPGIDPYSEQKRQIERYLFETPDMTSVILRSPIVIGPGEYAGRFWWYLQRVLDRRGVLLRNNGQAVIRLGFTEDVAGAIVAAALSPNTAGGTYNVGANELLTLRNFVRMIEDVYGIESRISGVSEHKLRMHDAIPWDDWRYEPFSWPANIAMSIDRAKADFNLANASIAQRIGETIEWHLSADLGDSFGYEFREYETELFNSDS